MRIPAGLALLLGIAVVGVGVAGVTLPPIAGVATASDGGVTAQTIEIVVDENGDAQIILTQSIPAETDSEQAAFETLAAEFEQGDHEIGGPTIIESRDRAVDTTGREMSIHNQTRTTTIDNETGILRHQFEWSNFARVDGEQIEIGDAFHTGSGHWLGTLTAEQRLVVTLPEGYRLETDASRVESTTLTDGQIIWEGPLTFEEGDIQLLLEPAPETPDQPGVEPSTIVVILGAGVVVIGVLWWIRGRQEPTSEPTAESPPERAESTTNPSAEEAQPVDPELLSDEERIEQMLTRHGGRMKQATIVEETNWSSAKVSQLLSEMEENGQIEKLRIGRENLISLPDEETAES